MIKGGVSMRSALIIAVLAVLVFVSAAPSSDAKTYVSLNGKFYIEYPDDWEQMDYITVDAFLSRRGAERDMFNYDAVLAPSESSPFFAGDYVIITLDLVGRLADDQIDSVVTAMGEDFRTGVTYQETDKFLTNLKSDKPSYDNKTKVLTVLNNIRQGEEIYKKNLVMMKFYNEGIASFFFYSNDSSFEAAKDTFKNIMDSFSTENIESVLPKEELKVADLETDDAGNLAANESHTKLYLSIAVLVLLGLVVLFIVRKKSK